MSRPLRLVLQSNIDAGLDQAHPGELVYDEAQWTARIHPATELLVVGDRKTRARLVLIKNRNVPQHPDLYGLLCQLNQECLAHGALSIRVTPTVAKWFYGTPLTIELPNWQHVCVPMPSVRLWWIVVYEDVASESSVLHSTIDTRRPSQPTVQDLLAEYRALKAPRAQIVISRPDERRIARAPGYLIDGWRVKWHERMSIFEGPAATRAEQVARLRGVAHRLPPVDTSHLGEPLEYAGYRWPHSHALILEAALIFRLPAYVLLWILDWLPVVHPWPEVDKIELIQGVYASIRQLRPKRRK